MPTTRDYLIATIMGENNRGTVESQQGVLDTIINRQGNPTEYGARRGASVQDIVTARTPTGGYQYDAWRPELNGRANGQFALSSAALQGRDALSGAAQRQYDQIAQVVDNYLNNGVGRGITQGATFYQTPDAPNAWQRNSLWPRFGQITVGDHIYSGPGLVRDRAEFERRNPDLFTSQQAPAPQQDGFGVIFNPSQGYDAGASGSLGGLTGLFETLPYGTSPNGGPGDALGNGDGAFDLGGAYPNQNVDPYAFGGTYNVAGGTDPGSFAGFLPPTETGGGYDFTGLNLGSGVGNGAFGTGIVQPGPAPAPYDFAGGFNPSQGVGPSAVGQLPAGFDEAAYKAANPDVAQAGIDARQHYLSFGAAEGRALAPPGWTQTQGAPSLSPTFGSGTTAPTYGPDGSVSVTSQGLVPTGTIGAPGLTGTIGAPQAVNGLPPDFDARSYLAINPDVAASGIDPGTHYRLFGAQEGRAYGAPGLTGTQGSPDLTGTYGPPAASPTLLPDGGISVMSPGLVPTQGAPSLTPTMGPGPTITARPGSFNGAEYLKANGDVAASGQDPLQHFLNYGAREGRAIDTLGNHFNGDAYLAQNRDVAMAGMNPLEHFLRYGAQEARTLAPTDWASPLTATTNAGTYGAPAATPTYGAPSLTPTIGAPGLTPTMGAPGLTPTLAAPQAIPSWSPGGGISNPFGFSGANVGSALGATPQTFASAYPLDTNIGYSSGGSPGGGGISDFGFSGADVSGFDVNAASPPMEGGSQGGGGGGGGGTAKGSSSSAAFLADQARTRAYWDTLAKPASLYGYTNTSTPPIVAAPVVPNLTLTNLNAANAGMGGAMLGSGLNLSINSRPLAGGFGFGF